MGALDAPAQVASFYVEKIKLASKLRVIPEGVFHFQAKSALTYFQTPTHEISLFASLNTLNDFFLYKTQKQAFRPISTVFNFSVRLVSIGLKVLHPDLVEI